MAGYAKFDGIDPGTVPDDQIEPGDAFIFDLDAEKAADRGRHEAATADTLEPFYGEFADLSANDAADDAHEAAWKDVAVVFDVPTNIATDENAPEPGCADTLEPFFGEFAALTARSDTLADDQNMAGSDDGFFIQFCDPIV